MSRADDTAIAENATIGVVGAGTMGAGIAQVALEAGRRVRIFDPSAAALDTARAAIASGLRRRGAKRGLQPDDAEKVASQTLENLSVVTSVEAVGSDSALVIEAAIEDLEVKRDLFRSLDAAAPLSALLATNTSALRVADIASATTRPDRVVGLHFFNPAPLMRLVEVVATDDTSEEVVARSVATMQAWGKTPVRSADAPGFIVNRVNRPFTIEALRLLETSEGTVPAIDDAIRAAGFPMGPFELMDLVGIDVNLAAARGVWEGFGRAERFRPSPIQERLVAEGHLGRKTGAGFYGYGAHGERLDPVDLPEAAGAVARPAAGADAIVERIVLAIVNEAWMAVAEHVATPADVDLALRLGAGHPVGPFERVDSMGGSDAVRRRLDSLAATVGPRFRPALPVGALE